MSVKAIKNWLRMPIDYPRARRSLSRQPALVGRVSRPTLGGRSPRGDIRADTPSPSPRRVTTAGGRSTIGAAERGAIGLGLATEALFVDGGRHLASLAIAAGRCECDIVLVCDRLRLGHLGRKTYGGLFLSSPNVRWQSPADFARRPSAVDAFWGDDESWRQTNRAFRPIGVRRDRLAGGIDLPYPMHPIQSRLHPDPSTLRSTPRSTRLFFGGNTKASYGKTTFAEFGGLMNRLRVIETAREVAAETGGESIDIRNVAEQPIAPQQWLPRVASADFFLCPPGSSQPVCHHLVEAMSVGTIPILQYGRHIDASLAGDDLAVGFADERSLRSALQRCLAMSVEEIRRRRDRICRWYDDHYRYDDAVAEVIRGRTEAPIVLRVHHENLYDPEPRVVSRPPTRSAA